MPLVLVLYTCSYGLIWKRNHLRNKNTHCQASFSKLIVHNWRFVFKNLVFKTIFTMDLCNRVSQTDVELKSRVYLNGEAVFELSWTLKTIQSSFLKSTFISNLCITWNEKNPPRHQCRFLMTSLVQYFRPLINFVQVEESLYFYCSSSSV